MSNFPLNPDLPTSYQRPGTYVFESRAGASPVNNNRRVLFLGYKTSAGAMQNDVAQRIQGEDDAVYYAGKGSDLVEMWRAYQSHNKGGSEVWFLAPPTPSGTAQTVKLTILAAPSGGTLDAVLTAAAAACVLTVWIDGWAFSVTVASGDTYATIASNLYAEIVKWQDYLPCTAGVSTATLTLTSRHAAVTSQDLPIRVNVSNAAASIAVSVGTLTVANSAGATGKVNLLTTLRSVSADVTSGDAATAIGTALKTAINSATAYPLYAAEPGTPTGVVTLFAQNDRTINRIVPSLTTVTTTTLTPSTATGAGLPSLTNTLTHLQSLPTFRVIVTNLTDFDVASPVYTPTGTLATHLESQGNGLSMKGQVLVFASTLKLTTAGALPAGSSPALTLSPRYFMCWAIGAIPQRACTSAARAAAEITNRLDYPAFNYAGAVLTTQGRVPMLLTETADLPTDLDVNAAMVSYYMTPLVSDGQGQLKIESGRTTAKPSATVDPLFAWWGVILANDVIRDDLVLSMPGFFAGKNLKSYGLPRTSFTCTPDGLRAALWSRIEFYASQDWIDDPDGTQSAQAAAVNIALPSRVDAVMALRYLPPAEQLSIVMQKVA